MRELTLHERIRNADASQQVENVKAKHAYLHGRADATGEWGVIWSRSDDCSWAHAFGRMRGFDQVYHGSVGLMVNTLLQRGRLTQDDLEELQSILQQAEEETT